MIITRPSHFGLDITGVSRGEGNGLSSGRGRLGAGEKKWDATVFGRSSPGRRADAGRMYRNTRTCRLGRGSWARDGEGAMRKSQPAQDSAIEAAHFPIDQIKLFFVEIARLMTPLGAKRPGEGRQIFEALRLVGDGLKVVVQGHASQGNAY